MTVLDGEKVAEILGIKDKEQVQPNGVDLRLDAVYSFRKSVYEFGVNEKEDESIPLIPENEEFEMKKGAYLVGFMERITIPRDCVGLVLPRSTLLRHGLDLRTALWDSGYEGKGRSMLVCYRSRAKLVRGSRIAQMVILRTEGVKEIYRGRYQGEE